MDLSYRQAGKLDKEYFKTKIDVDRSGLLDAVRRDLLKDSAGTRSIRAELCKLNVYGPFRVR